jgi:hypothetical protein
MGVEEGEMKVKVIGNIFNKIIAENPKFQESDPQPGTGGF